MLHHASYRRQLHKSCSYHLLQRTPTQRTLLLLAQHEAQGCPETAISRALAPTRAIPTPLLTTSYPQSIKRAMPNWPWNSKPSDDDDKKKRIGFAWSNSLNTTDWKHFTDPRNLVPVLLLSGTIIGSYAFYRSYLRRIPQANFISPSFWRRRSVFGRVTSVGDGDNFRLFHTPGGRLAGWGWLPWRRVPKEKKGLVDKTVSLCAGYAGVLDSLG